MISLVADKERELRATCERFGVRRLELFGSAATGDEFDPEHSDIDFLVEFQPEQNLGPGCNTSSNSDGRWNSFLDTRWIW
jgi:hypothetical protein